MSLITRAGPLVAALALVATPVAAAQPPDGADVIDDYPVAQGNYTTPDDFYQVFFRTPDGRGCGIGPNGGPVGCDAVPFDTPGYNQTVVTAGVPATYRFSDSPTFTRDVDILPAGRRLENWGASCGVGHQGTVTCRTYGGHGFILSSVYSVLW